MTTAAPSSNGTIHQNVVPSEVGWQFVPQYYTFVNKEPHRLHCFYNKSSTFIHGTEGEESKPCFGQQVSQRFCWLLQGVWGVFSELQDGLGRRMGDCVFEDAYR